MKTETNNKTTDKVIEEIRAATAQLSALRQSMSVLTPLTEAERREHRRASLGPRKLRTLENRVVAARQRRELLPPAFDMRKFERDAALTRVLGEFQAALEDLRMAVRDTLLSVGGSAMASAAIANAHLKVASGSPQTRKWPSPRGGRSTAKGMEPAEVPKPAEPAKPPVPEVPSETPVTPADKAA